MYKVKNVGEYPVIIRDLNLHVSGGKEVDLDTLFNQDTVRRSVDLVRLIEKGKIKVLSKNEPRQKNPVVSKRPPQKDPSQQQDSKMYAELKKDLAEIKDLLRASPQTVSEIAEQTDYDEDTLRQITDLQVNNLSRGTEEAERNFEDLGNSTEKKEKLDDLLNVLDSLGEKGDE